MTPLRWAVALVAIGFAIALAAIVSRIESAPKPDRSIVYASTPQGDLTLHVFEPAGSGEHGALVLFHGGGWQFGEPERLFPQAEHFATRGLVAISVEYRTGERHGTEPIDAMQDGITALRWIREHAVDLHIDPTRVAAGGSSAGAQIAALASTHDESADVDPTPNHRISPRPDALFLVEPVYDNSSTGYGNERFGSNWRNLSPLHTLRADMAPAIVFFGSNDGLTPLSSAEAFRDGMVDLGVRSELTVFAGGSHGFLNHGTPGAEDAYDEHLRLSEEFLSSLGWFSG